MNSKKMYKGLIRPLHDEIFSSWLNRGVNARDSRFIEAAGILLLHRVGDPDLDLRNSVRELILSILGCSAAELNNLMPNPIDRLPTKPNRRKYCASCIREDICRGHYPAVRKSWLHKWAVGCPIHLHPLSLIDKPVNDTNDIVTSAVSVVMSNRASWGKFEYLDLLRSVSLRPKLGCFLIAFRLQKWLTNAFKTNPLTLPSGRIISHIHLLQILDAAAISSASPLDRALLMNCAPPEYSNRNFRPEDNRPKGNKWTVYPIELATQDPLNTSILLTLFAIFIQVPSCISLWGVLGPRHNYQPSYCSELFPIQQGIKELIFYTLGESSNPHFDLVEDWLNRPGIEQLRYSPFLFM
jgi:hypothetical protein